MERVQPDVIEHRSTKDKQSKGTLPVVVEMGRLWNSSEIHE